MPNIAVRILGGDEAHVLDRVAEGVFDGPVDPRWAAEFFADPRHHLAVALDEETIVGMASGVRYVHPDKAPQLFVNEVAVAPAYQRRGVGNRLVRTLLEHGRTLGCVEAWVLTEVENEAARGLYRAAGGVEATEPIVMVEFDLRPDGDRLV